MMEHEWLNILRAPVLVEDACTILGSDPGHGNDAFNQEC